MISGIVFLLGLIIGSFLNAAIFRLETGENPLKGRSHCMNCNRELNWNDLVPLLSFVALGGKCRYCKKPISFQYPFVELATAVLFVLIFWHLNLEFIWNLEFGIWNVLYLWGIAGFLIAIFVYDLKHYIIPDKFLYSAIVLAGVWNLGFEFSLPFVQAILSGFGAASFFFAIYIISKGRAMGFGDVKLAFFMGLFLGWPNILVALFLAFFMGAIVGIGLIALKKKKLKSEVPFGPFLIAGLFVALFWGNQITDWYLRLLA